MCGTCVCGGVRVCGWGGGVWRVCVEGVQVGVVVVVKGKRVGKENKTVWVGSEVVWWEG